MADSRLVKLWKGWRKSGGSQPAAAAESASRAVSRQRKSSGQDRHPSLASLRPVPPVALLEVSGVPMETELSVSTLEELRTHVHETLCRHGDLDPSQTPLHQAIIQRSGRACGLYFMVLGPRQVKTYAVWAGEEKRILFYDSTNNRFAETRLSESPDPGKVAA
jgi:hypothetical protein